MTEENLKIEEIQKELETAKALAEENLNGWKRAKADLANFQKDAEKQKQELIMFSLASYVLATLPIYESVNKMIESIKNFHPSPFGRSPAGRHLSSPSLEEGEVPRSFSTTGIPAESLGSREGEAYFQGVQNIKKQFDDLFKNLGVKKIETIGKKFDPNFHESVGVKKSAPSPRRAQQGGSRQAGEEGEETDKILEEVQAGYTIGGKVIRPAKVVVAE